MDMRRPILVTDPAAEPSRRRAAVPRGKGAA